MNWADITIIGVIAVSVVVSVFRGFVREVLSLVAFYPAKESLEMLKCVEPILLVPELRFRVLLQLLRFKLAWFSGA